MNVLIVVESCFGCTAEVAEAVASGLRSADASVTVVAAEAAPSVDGFDLIVAGAPTHNLGLPWNWPRESSVQVP